VVSVARTVPRLKSFVENGGTLIAIGDSTSVASHFELPIDDPLVETRVDGSTGPIPPERFYVPGSILRVAVDTTQPLASGLEKNVDLYFDNSPVFRLGRAAASHGIKPVAWFASRTPLRSGWAWGQSALDGAVAVVDAPLGRGRVLLFGPDVTFRAQPHGAFKFLFNGILDGGSVVRSTPQPR
jgi:hypothetical protein